MFGWEIVGQGLCQNMLSLGVKVQRCGIGIASLFFLSTSLAPSPLPHRFSNRMPRKKLIFDSTAHGHARSSSAHSACSFRNRLLKAGVSSSLPRHNRHLDFPLSLRSTLPLAPYLNRLSPCPRLLCRLPPHHQIPLPIWSFNVSISLHPHLRPHLFPTYNGKCSLFQRESARKVDRRSDLYDLSVFV